MITAEFLTTANGNLLGFGIFDHAGFAKEGEDIVCAAVSSAAYLTINTVTDVLHITPEILKVSDANMQLRIESKDAKMAKDILEGLKLHMQGLEEQYSDYIRVGYTEV